jgi:hypothetical protein
MLSIIFMEVYQSNVAVEILHQRRVALHPIAAIEIINVADRFNFSTMNVAADHSFRFVLARHLWQSLRILYLLPCALIFF